MGSLSFSEILVILVVILVVFGPRRLPELSRRAGEVLAKLREATSYVSQAIDSEYGEAMEPIRDLKREIDGLKGDVTRAISSVSDIDIPVTPESASTPPESASTPPESASTPPEDDTVGEERSDSSDQ